MATVDDLYQAFTDAGPSGLAMAAVNRLHKTDPDRPRILPTERAAAGRHLRQLLDSNTIVEIGKGRWAATTAGEWTAGDTETARAARPVPQAAAVLPPDETTAARPARVAVAEPVVDPALLAYATDAERLALRIFQATNAGDDWETWVKAVFPTFATKPFGVHHTHFWEHIWSIRAHTPTDPYVACWARDHAKSSSCEMAAVRLGVTRVRRYCLYVCSEQDLADQHVDTIASMLGDDMIVAAYPDFADRAVGKYGTSRGWRRNRLHTKGGFVVDALGLDTAARGRRIDEQRPDLFIIDDVDGQEDTPRTVDRKIREITRKILPAGAQDLAVLAVQNKVHPNSIFARLVSRGLPGEPVPADFLAGRIVSGPIPAIWNFEWTERVADGARHYDITDGVASWEGMPLDACQHQLNTFGLAGFLAEFQHDEPDLDGGMFAHIDFDIQVRVSEAQLPPLVRLCTWVDPAVSKTDRSDSCGVSVAGLGVDRRYYFLWAWEQRATPTEALTVAARAAIEYGCEVLGVETDQGGDTWKVVYQQVMAKIVDELTATHGGELPPEVRIPRYESAKAGSAQMSKADRLQRMVTEYDLGRIKHVETGALVLERGLRRFPLYPPFDVADSAWHAWNWLATKGRGNPLVGGQTRTRAAKGVLPQFSPSSLPGTH